MAPFGNLDLPNSSHFSDFIAYLSKTQLFALENVTQYLFGTKSFYVSIRFPLSVLCMDIRSYPYSNPFVFFVFLADRLLEPVCCKKRPKKVLTKKLVSGIGDLKKL